MPCPPPEAFARPPARVGRVIRGLAKHGGAYGTSMEVDPDRQFVAIFLVQHAGYPGDDGQAKPTLTKAFRAAYSK